MPNWVQQKVVIRGDIVRLRNLQDGLHKKEFCNTVLPMPFVHASSRDDGWRDWAILNWGTKWDVADIDDITLKTYDNETGKLTFTCNTANTAPQPVWDHLFRLGLRVSAAYADTMMDLYGFYEDGDDMRDSGAATMVSMMLDIDIDQKEYA